MPERSSVHQVRYVQGGLHTADRRTWYIHPGGDRRKGHLHPLRPVRQCLPAHQHHRGLRISGSPLRREGPGQGGHRQHLSLRPRGAGRGIRNAQGFLCPRENGGPAAGPGRRLCAGYQLCRRPDHRGGGQRADPAHHHRGQAPTPVHQLLPRLGQVRGDLLPGAAAQHLQRQEPHRDAGPHHQDLLRQEDGH